MGVKRVAVIGPECTGKSELSKVLASDFNATWIPEYAREYLDSLSQPYGPEDLLNIARGQIEQEDRLAAFADQVLVCDTNLYVIKVWSNFKYGYCDPWILQQIAERSYDLYLLTYIDIPWEYDPLREHPDQREELYAIYLQEMKNQSVPFVEIKGTREQRRELAARSLSNLLTEGDQARL